MSTRTFILTMLACASLAASANAETRSFIDQSGRALEGELVSVSGDMVTIKRTSDGQVFTVKAATFSQADQAYFASKDGAAPAIPATVGPVTKKPTAPAGTLNTTASTAPLRIELKVYPNKNEKAKSGGYYDDKIQRISYRVDIRNGEQQRALDGGKATMMAFAKNLEDTSEAQVISKEEFGVNLKPLGTLTQDTKETKIVYDNLYYKYGYKYSGYVCVIKDQAGKTVVVTGSTPAFEKGVEDLLKLNVGDVYDKSYKLIENRSLRTQ